MILANALPKAGAVLLHESWFDREELAYDRALEKSQRWGVAHDFVGGKVLLRLGVPDTFFTIPAFVVDVERADPAAKARVGAYGFVDLETDEQGQYLSFHPSRKDTQ